MRHAFSFLALVIASLGSAADVVDSTRRADATWTDAGVPGGTWQYRGRTVSNVTGLDLTGATDSTSAINSAIAAASSGTAVVLPATTGAEFIRVEGAVVVNKTGVTLRGAGAGIGGGAATTIKLYGSGSVSVAGEDTDFGLSNFPSGVTTTATASRGATTITVSDGTDFAADLTLCIKRPNDWANQVIHVQGYNNSTWYEYRITNKAGNVLTLFPPLQTEVVSGTPVSRETGNGDTGHISYAGLEDMVVDGTNKSSGTTNVSLGAAWYSWLYNVKSTNAPNYNFSFSDAIQSTMRHCTGTGVQSSGSASSRAALSIGQTTACLVEDNIFADQRSGILAGARNAGTVIRYNYVGAIYVATVIGSALNTNHDPCNTQLLVEYNITSRLQDDGYHGGSRRNTYAFNLAHGTYDYVRGATVTGNQLPMTFNRFNRYNNYVGNVIGRTGEGITWTYSNIATNFNTTSSSSLGVSTGAKTGTMIGTGLQYHDNGSVALFYRTSDPTTWMTGRITSYVTGTGSCTFTVYRTNGSGTYTDWTVVGGSGYGPSGTEGLVFALGAPNIGGGGFSGEMQVAAPDALDVWWRVYDGTPMVRQGAFNASNAYTVGDVVDLTAAGPSATTGGNDIHSWIAVNAAKNGLTTWETPSASSTDWSPVSQNSFQELDYDVYATALIKGNWNAATEGIHSSETLGGGETFPTYGYSASAKPNLFGSLSWPPWTADSVPADMDALFPALPAGYRYINDAEVPGYNADDSGGGGGDTGSANININGNLIIQKLIIQ